MYIYKFINKLNEVIYVGKSKNFKSRLNQHYKSKKWIDEVFEIEIGECSTLSDMNIYEVYYIAKYKPIYNKDCKEDDDITLKIEPLEFKKYEEVDLKKGETVGLDINIKYTKLRDKFKKESTTTVGLFFKLVNYISQNGSNRLVWNTNKGYWYSEVGMSKNGFNKHFDILKKLNLITFVRNSGMYINPKYVYFKNKKIDKQTIKLFKEEINE